MTDPERIEEALAEADARPMFWDAAPELKILAAALREAQEREKRLLDLLRDARQWIALTSDVPAQHAETLIRVTREVDAALAVSPPADEEQK